MDLKITMIVKYIYNKTIYCRVENNAFKLWIPDNSDFVGDNQWLEENAPPEIRCVYGCLIRRFITKVCAPISCIARFLPIVQMKKKLP